MSTWFCTTEESASHPLSGRVWRRSFKSTIYHANTENGAKHSSRSKSLSRPKGQNRPFTTPTPKIQLWIRPLEGFRPHLGNLVKTFSTNISKNLLSCFQLLGTTKMSSPNRFSENWKCRFWTFFDIFHNRPGMVRKGPWSAPERVLLCPLANLSSKSTCWSLRSRCLHL